MRCLVCACEVEAIRTHCAKCAAPHHLECWEFLSGCGRYACGGRRLAGSSDRPSELCAQLYAGGFAGLLLLLALIPHWGRLAGP